MRNLKILIVSSNYFPELTGIGKYVAEMAEWLAERGHEVSVITGVPYYPDWKRRAGYPVASWRTDAIKGVQVTRCPLWIPKRPSGLKRVVHLLTFGVAAFVPLLGSLRTRSADVAMVVEPPLVCAPVVSMLGRARGVKTWLHIQDYEVDAAFDMGFFRGQALRRWVSAVESWLMRQFSRVSTISARMMDRAEAKGVDPSRLRYFPNWVDIAAIQTRTMSSFRSELGIEANAVIALYSGNMGAKQGLEILAHVARLLQQRRDIVFVFCGGGSGKEDLVRQCGGLPNVRFLPLQPLERLSDLLSLADVHLLPQRGDAADLVMPSKLSGMLASGRCVVATAAPQTELAEVVSHTAECGLVSPPEDPKAMAAAIVELAGDPARRARLGMNGRKYAERNLSRDSVLRKFEQEVLDLVRST